MGGIEQDPGETVRIVLLTSSSNRSGGARQALYLAQGMQRRGHEVFFFTKEGSELRSLDPEASFWHNLGEEKEWRRNVEAVLFDGKGRSSIPTVVHAFHNRAVKRLAWWGLCWRRRGIVCVAHRGVVFRPKNPLPYWSPGVDGFIVNSRACMDLLHSLGVGQKRLRLVYNAVPDERVTPLRDAQSIRDELGLLPKHHIFGTVGGDNPVKGVSVLLQAFAQADIREARLLVLGVQDASWTRIVRELGIENRVRLLGKTDHVADYLQVMTAFVLPSLSESMPNTLLEALRCHLPCICSEVGGVAEVIGKAGLLVPPGDAHALAAAMKRFCYHEDARCAMQRASVEQARSFEPRHRLDALEEIYKGLLSSRGYALP